MRPLSPRRCVTARQLDREPKDRTTPVAPPTSSSGISNILIVGGPRVTRLATALACHQSSALGPRPLVAVDCATQEAQLLAALEAWVTGPTEAAEPALLKGCAGGMLYLDAVERLSPATQRLLLLLAHQLPAHSYEAVSLSVPCRLAAGSPGDLREQVAAGTFDAELLDCLDKLRIEVGGGEA